MESPKNIQNHYQRLMSRYKRLMEQAYNFRQTDSAFSDISEYKAIKLLSKLNKLKFLNSDLKEIQPK